MVPAGTVGSVKSVSDSSTSAGSGLPGRETVVLIPVKSFDLAKGRLADLLDAGERGRLARQMAAGVVAAARPLPTYVVCDNEIVAQWAATVGAEVLPVTAVGLNPAITEAVGAVGRLGHDRVIISHADLPLARDLTWLAAPPHDRGVVVVSDRHGRGTNVMALPLDLDPPFVFHYGPASAHKHRAEAERLGLPVQMVDDERLAWDLDTPDDLTAWLTESADRPQRQPKGSR